MAAPDPHRNKPNKAVEATPLRSVPHLRRSPNCNAPCPRQYKQSPHVGHSRFQSSLLVATCARPTVRERLPLVDLDSRRSSPPCCPKLFTSSVSVAPYREQLPSLSHQDFAICGVESIETTFSVHGFGSHIESRSALYMMVEISILLHIRQPTAIPFGRGISESFQSLIADTFTISSISSRTPSSISRPLQPTQGEQADAGNRLKPVPDPLRSAQNEEHPVSVDPFALDLPRPCR